jgi:hypothetical protein
MRRRAAVVVAAALLAAAVAVGSWLLLARASHPRPAAASRVGAVREAVVLEVTGGRAHPRGPELDEVTRAPRGGAWDPAKPLWKGAGRHPMWRGCQHRFDPQLTTFVFGTTTRA